jgi:hypothetical protein
MLIPTMTEGAVGEIIELMQMQFNTNLEQVYSKYSDPSIGLDAAKINLPFIPVDRYYVSDAVEPLMLPACFVIVDNTEFDLEGAQNYHKATHRIFLAMLAYDFEIQRLTRMAWRYALAAHITLHDKGQAIGAAPTSHILVRETMYSPTYRSRGQNPDQGQRAFRKDVTLRLEVHQYERFQVWPS